MGAAVHSPRPPDLGTPDLRTHNPSHPAPGGAPPPAQVAVGEAATEGLVLARRVPQAHLAPELRRHGQGASTAEPEGALPDASEARAALSRYQASRQAARAVVEEGRGGRAGDAGPGGPPADGGWS